MKAELPEGIRQDLLVMAFFFLARVLGLGAVKEETYMNLIEQNPLAEYLIERGRQEGEVAASRRMLQRHLSKRYPALVEEREQVEQLDDVEALEALLDALLESDTPQPFQEKLKALLTPSKTA